MLLFRLLLLSLRSSAFPFLTVANVKEIEAVPEKVFSFISTT